MEQNNRIEEQKNMKGGVPASEQETTITYTRNLAYADVWTSDRTVMTKLDRLCKEAPENYQCADIGKDLSGRLISKAYRIRDKRLLSFRSTRPSRPPRVYTEEELAVLRERLARARNRQGNTPAEG